MKKLVVLLAASAAVSALAAPGGALDTLPLGIYLCEMPGDATGPVGLRVPEADFRVLNASSYTTANGTGTYLLRGDDIIMTSGPLNGVQYRRLSSGLLRLVENGKDARQRCVLHVSNNGR